MTLTVSQQVRNKTLIQEETTVYIKSYDKPGEQIHFCMFCRAPLFAVRGKAVVILPGASPQDLPFIKQCPNRSCGHKWRVQAFV